MPILRHRGRLQKRLLYEHRSLWATIPNVEPTFAACRRFPCNVRVHGLLQGLCVVQPFVFRSKSPSEIALDMDRAFVLERKRSRSPAFALRGFPILCDAMRMDLRGMPMISAIRPHERTPVQ